MQLCFTTTNLHKLKEVNSLLKKEFKIISLHDIGFKKDLPETKDTLEGNSLQKAETIYQLYGINCFSDDTGLEVEALRGEPGVRSARYAGEAKNDSANRQLLLQNLSMVNNRQARFRTIITLIWKGNVFQFEGVLNGMISKEERGQNGFGYDSIFIPDGQQLTLAEINLDIKNNLSHRSIAIKKLAEFLNKL